MESPSLRRSWSPRRKIVRLGIPGRSLGLGRCSWYFGGRKGSDGKGSTGNTRGHGGPVTGRSGRRLRCRSRALDGQPSTTLSPSAIISSILRCRVPAGPTQVGVERFERGLTPALLSPFTKGPWRPRPALASAPSGPRGHDSKPPRTSGGPEPCFRSKWYQRQTCVSIYHSPSVGSVGICATGQPFWKFREAAVGASGAGVLDCLKVPPQKEF